MGGNIAWSAGSRPDARPAVPMRPRRSASHVLEGILRIAFRLIRADRGKADAFRHQRLGVRHEAIEHSFDIGARPLIPPPYLVESELSRWWEAEERGFFLGREV